MGTGIVSIATDLLGMRPVAVSMFWFNVGAYAVLWILTMARLIAYPGLVKRDLMDHRQGPGFFTAVAGTCVMGSQLIVLHAAYRVATVLWAVGILLWVGMYTVSTYQVAQAMEELRFLDVIPRVFVYVALAAWAVVFCWLVRSTARVLAVSLAGIRSGGNEGAAPVSARPPR